MRTLLLTLGAAINMYLSGTAVASAQSYGGWLCNRYGIFCQSGPGTTPTTNVPEIDVSSGLLAVAAIAATLALVWEIKRRRA